jgi:uncharacterized protein (TIGR03083 family)
MVAMNEQLAELTDDDFARETDCTGWRVRDIVAHMTASAEEMKWPWGFPVRFLRGHRRYPEMAELDARNQIQIDDLSAFDNAALVAHYRERQPSALTGVRLMPALLRKAKAPSGLPGVPKIGIAYLFDVICTRDIWMHAIDIEQATGKRRVVGTYDEAIIDQIIRDLGVEWSGPTIELQLTGASNKRWKLGTGEVTAMANADAIELSRMLAGRPGNPPELVSGDSAALPQLHAARVLF